MNNPNSLLLMTNTKEKSLLKMFKWWHSPHTITYFYVVPFVQQLAQELLFTQCSHYFSKKPFDVTYGEKLTLQQKYNVSDLVKFKISY